jgi:hypothetical protein
VVGLNPPILLILAYGQTTSANRSLSHSKRDRSTITKPIKAIAQSTAVSAPTLAAIERMRSHPTILTKLQGVSVDWEDGAIALWISSTVTSV